MIFWWLWIVKFFAAIGREHKVSFSMCNKTSVNCPSLSMCACAACNRTKETYYKKKHNSPNTPTVSCILQNAPLYLDHIIINTQNWEIGTHTIVLIACVLLEIGLSQGLRGYMRNEARVFSSTLVRVWRPRSSSVETTRKSLWHGWVIHLLHTSQGHPSSQIGGRVSKPRPTSHI